LDGTGGLIHSYLLDGKGGARTMGWQDVSSWQPSDGVLWVHLDYMDEVALAWLRNESGLNALTCEALIEEETRPRSVVSNDGLLLILRSVNFNPGSDPEDMVALRMWVDEGRIISLRHRKVRAVEDVLGALEAGNGATNAAHFLLSVLTKVTDRMGDVVSDIDDLVDELEDEVLHMESHELRSRLSEIRRQTISLRRYIAPQRDVLSRLYSERLSWLSDMVRLHIREEAELTSRYVEDLDSARDRAAITHEELNSRIAEQMNRTMYILSLVAAVFLPLGFLTGLLGINVGGIPGADDGSAFYIVCGIMAAIAVFEFWLFKRKKWL